jgi:hypothetical protein
MILLTLLLHALRTRWARRTPETVVPVVPRMRAYGRYNPEPSSPEAA